MTAPDPLWHPQGLFMCDVGEEAQADHEDITPRVARVMGNLLEAAAGDCTQGLCKVRCSQANLHTPSGTLAGRQCASGCRAVAGCCKGLAFEPLGSYFGWELRLILCIQQCCTSWSSYSF